MEQSLLLETAVVEEKPEKQLIRSQREKTILPIENSRPLNIAVPQDKPMKRSSRSQESKKESLDEHSEPLGMDICENCATKVVRRQGFLGLIAKLSEVLRDIELTSEAFPAALELTEEIKDISGKLRFRRTWLSHMELTSGPFDKKREPMYRALVRFPEKNRSSSRKHWPCPRIC